MTTPTTPTFPDFPLHLGGHGATAVTDGPGHLRDLIEQLLFTGPGERVNRPGFGSGLLQLLFLPNSEPLAAATQAAVTGALAQWLGDRIQVRGVEVVANDATLEVTVRYTDLDTGQAQVETFSRGAP